ncbi:MAG: hypothetical protein J4473_04695 [Candidatus Aenigmarchaeota archaeon]|nr:hypothetical protein [Candidatus Aenigmarchaeota archaeon]
MDKIKIINTVTAFSVVLAIIFFLWYIFGNSPTSEQIVAILIIPCYLFMFGTYKSLNNTMNIRFEKINDKIDEKFEKVNEKFEKVNEKFEKTNERLMEISERLVRIEGRRKR